MTLSLLQTDDNEGINSRIVISASAAKIITCQKLAQAKFVMNRAITTTKPATSDREQEVEEADVNTEDPSQNIQKREVE